MLKLLKWTTILTISSVLVFVLSKHLTSDKLNQTDAIRELTQDAAYSGPKSEGLKLQKIDEALYSLTGNVESGDCRKIVPQLPKRFAVILESPGGDLSEGMCIASHFSIRDVITVVREDPVINEMGEEVYTPATLESSRGRVVCASSCSLMFLGGSRRFLIGDVWLGIHGPRTPEAYLSKINKSALEAQAYQISAKLLVFLKKLGVEDEEVRLAFIRIPATTMYWLRPTDFRAKPELSHLATDYRKFWGFTGSIAQGEH